MRIAMLVGLVACTEPLPTDTGDPVTPGPEVAYHWADDRGVPATQGPALEVYGEDGSVWPLDQDTGEYLVGLSSFLGVAGGVGYESEDCTGPMLLHRVLPPDGRHSLRVEELEPLRPWMLGTGATVMLTAWVVPEYATARTHNGSGQGCQAIANPEIGIFVPEADVVQTVQPEKTWNGRLYQVDGAP